MHNTLTRAAPPNSHASPCFQGWETPRPPPGHTAARGQAQLTTAGLREDKAEKPGWFLARKRHFRATAAFHRGETLWRRKPSGLGHREFPGEFACIKLKQNTIQHEMHRAEVFLSHVHTHTQNRAGQHTFDRQDPGNPVLATVCFFTVG